MTLQETIQYAEEQLAMVMRGEMPTELGKILIGQLSKLKYLNS